MKPQITRKAQKHLSREDLRNAAWLYFVERWSWERIAAELKCERKTIYNRRMTDPEWADVVAEVVEELRSRALPIARGALDRAARNGDVSAAKELLARVEGAIAQKSELSGSLETGPDLSSLSDEDFARYVQLHMELQRLTRGRKDPAAG